MQDGRRVQEDPAAACRFSVTTTRAQKLPQTCMVPPNTVVAGQAVASEQPQEPL